MLTLALLLLGFTSLSLAKTVTYDWDITWVTASPDGYARPVIGINGQWPCPQIDVDMGDRVVVNVHNALGNQSTTLHWHGIFQTGTSTMDGATGTGQCPIPPGGRFKYDFKIDQPGTYWYHSHNMGQMGDGLRGPIIVHDDKAPYAGKFDEEITITLSDWYHSQMPDLLNYYESNTNENFRGGLEPDADSGLINDGQNVSIPVKPGKTYLVHIVNIGNFAGHAIYFDGHPFTAVEIDGVYVEPKYIGSQNIRIATGQRWSFLVDTKKNTDKNFAIFATLDINMMFPPKGVPPPGYNPNITAWLVYDDKKPLPPPIDIQSFDFFDEMNLVPYDRQRILNQVDHHITMDTGFTNISGVNRATINGVTQLIQKVPSLYTAMTVGDEYSSNPLVYGQVNPFVLKYKEVVEIVINNVNTDHNNLHPWHLHGHNFQVIERSAPQAGAFSTYASNISSTPVRRDTIMVNPNGYAVIRFQADNPGVWLFHCHIEWHVSSGLVASMIEAPDHLKGLHIPEDHIDNCKAYGMAYAGNAAGNVKDPLNLDGSVTEVPVDSHGAMYTKSSANASHTSTPTASVSLTPIETYYAGGTKARRRMRAAPYGSVPNAQ